MVNKLFWQFEKGFANMFLGSLPLITSIFLSFLKLLNQVKTRCEWKGAKR